MVVKTKVRNLLKHDKGKSICLFLMAYGNFVFVLHLLFLKLPVFSECLLCVHVVLIFFGNQKFVHVISIS